MSSDPPLTESDRALLSARADRFFSALGGGDVTDWEPFLGELPPHVRRAVLVELVILDLEKRWTAGQRPTVEEYAVRFPELGPSERLPPKLIVEEYRSRRKSGEPRDADQYRVRFPVQFSAVQSALAVVDAGRPSRPSAVTPHGGSAVADAYRSRSNEYQFVRKLGSGVFGEVWLARSATGIEKAIKILHQSADEESARRELRSLELIKNLRHPFLLTTEDYWIADNRLYVVMELADDTLRGRLKECRDEGLPGIPETELFVTVSEAAEGLDFLHEMRVMHRDVKPDNILLSRGHAKVADFGLARQQEQLIAQMSVFAGSPAYMAPEVWAGQAGPASDLYSFACTYAELRQGRLPVKGGAVTEVMFAHLEGRFEFDPLIGPAEREVLLKALAKEPDRRHESCMEFVREMAQALGRTYRRPPPKAKSGSRLVPIVPVVDLVQSDPALIAVGSAPTPSGGSVGGSVAGSVAAPPVPSAKSTHKPTHTARPTAAPPSPPPHTPTTATARGTLPRTRPPANRRWIALAVVLVVVFAICGLVTTLFFAPHPDPTNTGGGGTNTGSGSGSSAVTSVVFTPQITPAVSTAATTGPVIPPGSYAPPGTVGEAGTEMETAGGQVFKWATATVGGEKLRFRFIPAGNPDGVRSFYISEQKVPNRIFRKDKPPVEDKASGIDGPDAPATGMTAAEAKVFIDEHFAAAKGRLPTPAEWDHASGFHAGTGRAGVTLPGGVPWVDKKGPGPAHRWEQSRDVSQFQLLDMAGNGREWTCGALTKRGEPPVIEPRTAGAFDAKELLVVRGRNYTLAGDLTFATIAAERAGEPQTQLAGKASPYTGFRVVLP